MVKVIVGGVGARVGEHYAQRGEQEITPVEDTVAAPRRERPNQGLGDRRHKERGADGPDESLEHVFPLWILDCGLASLAEQ